MSLRFPRWLFLFMLGSKTLCQTLGQATDPEFQDLAQWLSSHNFITSKVVVIEVRPSVLLDPKLTSNDYETRQRGIVSIADGIPYPTPIFTVSGRNTFDVYRVILDNRDTDQDGPTQQEKATLRSAERILLRHECFLRRLFGLPRRRLPSRRLQRYRYYEEQSAMLQTELSRTADAKKITELALSLDKLSKDWGRYGYKKQVEDALASFTQTANGTAGAFWSAAADAFHANVNESHNPLLPNTYLRPGVSDLTMGSAWTAWNQGQSSGDISVLRILRPWIKMEALESKQWNWAAGRYRTERVLVSDGKGMAATSTNLRNSLMPLIPVALVVTRATRTGSGSTSDTQPRVVAMLCEILPAQPL